MTKFIIYVRLPYNAKFEKVSVSKDVGQAMIFFEHLVDLSEVAEVVVVAMRDENLPELKIADRPVT